MSASMPAATLYQHPAGDGILWPELQAEWYETSDYLSATSCVVIDLAPPAFAALVPALADLPYLAHARQVAPSGKADDVLLVSGDGWYSVVVGSRLPDPPAGGQPGQRNIVHLVSLEGFEDYIAGTKTLPAGTSRVRMISLQSWVFTCLPEQGASFAELANGLLQDSAGNPKSTTFALPADPPAEASDEASYAFQALGNGYVPLRYQTRLGEQTFGWYRGPFSPVPVPNFLRAAQLGADDPAGWQPIGSASAALIYDPNYGVFDVSYAVAWETGRLVALSSALFGQELLAWQQSGHQLIDLVMERKSQIAALASFNPSNPDPATEQSLLEQIQPYALTGDFMTYLITQFGEQIAPKLYDQPPNPPDPPLPAYPNLPPPPANPQTIADLLQESDVQTAVLQLGAQGLDTIDDWLAQLYLLIGVPFENLVPHAALLPAESVRFFYLDANWQTALVEGALSIGIGSSRDQVYQDMMKALIWDATLAAAEQVREALLSAPPPAGSTPALDQQMLAGMLLRSALVSGWPGLEINAYMSYTTSGSPATAQPDLATQINLLRMERLSSDVLLCLWPAVPAVVTIDEPREGIAFGFADPPPGQGAGAYLYLRSLDAEQYGMPICSDTSIEQGGCLDTPGQGGSPGAIDAVARGLIDPATRRVKIGGAGGLLDVIAGKLGVAAVQVRDFAVQMIKVPEQAIIAAPPAPAEEPR